MSLFEPRAASDLPRAQRLHLPLRSFLQQSLCAIVDTLAHAVPLLQRIDLGTKHEFVEEGGLKTSVRRRARSIPKLERLGVLTPMVGLLAQIQGTGLTSRPH